MVCAAYAANVLENALSTLGHEARERAFNQTDELLADYSQWPFGRKAVHNEIGENLPQVIAEVRLFPSHAGKPSRTDPPTGSQQVPREGTPAGGRCRLPCCLHPPRLAALRGSRLRVVVEGDALVNERNCPPSLSDLFAIFRRYPLSLLFTCCASVSRSLVPPYYLSLHATSRPSRLGYQA